MTLLAKLCVELCCHSCILGFPFSSTTRSGHSTSPFSSDAHKVGNTASTDESAKMSRSSARRDPGGLKNELLAGFWHG